MFSPRPRFDAPGVTLGATYLCFSLLYYILEQFLIMLSADGEAAGEGPQGADLLPVHLHAGYSRRLAGRQGLGIPAH